MKPDSEIFISLVVPFYNSQDKIGFFLDSIKLQNCDKIEVIFIDDGSTDSTQKIINQNLDGSNVNFKLIKKKNGGVSSARNLGLNNARGKYVMFVDSDDALLNNAVSLIAQAIEDSKDAECLVFEYVRLKAEFRHKAFECYPTGNRFYNASRTEILKDYISGELIKSVHMCSCVYKLEFLRYHGLTFDESFAYGEDQKFVIDCLVSGECIKYFGFPILAYIDYPTSATGRYNYKWFHSYQMFNSLYRNSDFLDYRKDLENRMNNELLSISNKIIMQSKFLKSLKFIKTEIIPLRSGINELAFWLLFNFPSAYIAMYKLYIHFK